MDGTVLKRIQLPSANALGARVMVALRPALHGALLDAVGIESVSFSSGATGFALGGDRVTLHTARGDVHGDLLVGADGLSSVVRRVLHPSERVKWLSAETLHLTGRDLAFRFQATIEG